MVCPCGSGKKLEECCGIHIKNRDAKTAKELMRSRYTAYVVGDIDYIVSTTHISHRSDLDEEAIQKWSQNSEWLGIEILRTEAGKENDSEGIVEFTVRFRENGLIAKQHEISKFVKEEGHWFYKDSEFPKQNQSRRTDPKIGRNDPCPCGSGKKYKKCCGKNI